MLGQNLKQLYESLGPRQCVSMLTALLKKGEVKPEDFSLRECAEAFCGNDWVRKLNPANIAKMGSVNVLEAGEAVDVSAFSNITGQIVYTKVHQGWDQVQKLGEKLFTNVPTQFASEKVPGIGRIKGDGEAIHPGQPYPELGFGEQYWETPITTKHGFIVSVEAETIFFDRTALVLKRAGEAGERAAYNKEKRQLACVAGITITVGNESFDGNNHKWNGNTYNTYSTTAQTNGNDTIQINAKASIDLADWTNLEALWLLFQAQTDPDTGLPINFNPDTLVVMPYKWFTGHRIVSATEVRSGDITTGAGTQTLSSNPIGRMFSSVYTSPLLEQLIVASGVSSSNSKYWFFVGEPKKAFEYRENWPLTVVQAPSNSEAEFTRDIVLRYKVSERGVPWVADPRYMAKGYNS